MKFIRLKIESFLAISTGEVKLDDRGLVLIQGVNNDDTSAASNGAGKSSLADALCWCLYGVTARGVSGDAVINETAGKGTRVEVTIDDDGVIWTIARHRKHKTGKNSLTVTAQPTTIGASVVDHTKGKDALTQEVVTKVVGASYEVFKAAVYSGQEQMADLPGMTDKELKLLIEEAAGVTVLEEAYAKARVAVSAVMDELDRIDNQIQRQDDRIAIFTKQLAGETARSALWDQEQEEKINDKTAELRSYVTAANPITATIKTLRDEASLIDEIAKIDASIAAIDHENMELEDRNRLLSGAQSAVAVKEREKDHAAARAKAAKAALETVRHKIGCACEGCGREITTNEIAATEAQAKVKLNDEARALKLVMQELEAAQETLRKRQEERDAFRATMTDVSAASQLRGDLQAELDKLRMLIKTRDRHVTQARLLAETIKQLKAEKNPLRDAIVTTEQNLKEAQAERAELVGRHDECLKRKAQADAVVKVFSPAGVRAHILDEVTPYLNDRTAHYLSTLSDGNIEATWTTLTKNAKGELKEKFSIEVANDHGAQSFAGLSGGEKRKVRVATALALQDLVATRAAKQIDLFIGDEIDHALDEPGLERLTQILEEKANERGSVFVISHNSLTDWISQVIVVKKTGKQSVIEEVTA